MYWLNNIVFHTIVRIDCGAYQEDCDDMKNHLTYGLWYPQELINHIDHLIETSQNF